MQLPSELRKILIIGDSFAGWGFGHVLERELKKVPGLQVRRFYKISTGLCVPAYFDWFSQLETLLAEGGEELVIVALGANDTHALMDDDRKYHQVATEGWNEIYGRRVKRLADIAGEAGASLVWVGLPVMRKKQYGERVRNLNAVAERGCSAAPNCRFFDTWNILADPSGAYIGTAIMPDGKRRQTRASDAIHLSTYGAELIVADFLASADRWAVRGIPLPDAGPEASGPAVRPAVSGTSAEPAASMAPTASGPSRADPPPGATRSVEASHAPADRTASAERDAVLQTAALRQSVGRWSSRNRFPKPRPEEPPASKATAAGESPAATTTPAAVEASAAATAAASAEASAAAETPATSEDSSAAETPATLEASSAATAPAYTEASSAATAPAATEASAATTAPAATEAS
ncbi:MAG: DUF459 domain-containing protein, partial [Deltaproteobacteria bacterium]|nr:DUF459 domain-containing protein [Deltaproteobacteria bacterium]